MTHSGLKKSKLRPRYLKSRRRPGWILRCQFLTSIEALYQQLQRQ